MMSIRLTNGCCGVVNGISGGSNRQVGSAAAATIRWMVFLAGPQPRSQRQVPVGAPGGQWGHYTEFLITREDPDSGAGIPPGAPPRPIPPGNPRADRLRPTSAMPCHAGYTGPSTAGDTATRRPRQVSPRSPPTPRRMPLGRCGRYAPGIADGTKRMLEWQGERTRSKPATKES